MSLARQKLLRLPLEQGVREALDSLAEHDVGAGGRIQGTEMQIRELAGAAAMAPLCGEDDEIQSVSAFDLEPARAAISGLVGGIQRFRHETFVPGRESRFVEGPRRRFR